MMKATHTSFGRITLALACAACVSTISTKPAGAELIVFDTFDAEPVGAFPSTWTDVTPTVLGEFYVTNNIPGTPTAPNVFQLANRSNEAFEVRREFPTVSLNVSSQVVFNYRLNLSQIPGGGSEGFTIGPTLVGVGDETFATIRVTSDGAGWRILNPWFGISGGANIVTNGLALNTWYDFLFEVDPSSTNAGKGVVRWYINGSLINTESQFSVPTVTRTNMNALKIRNSSAVPNPPITTFYLDNVRVFVEVPEPSGATLMLGAAVAALLMRPTRRNG